MLVRIFSIAQRNCLYLAIEVIANGEGEEDAIKAIEKLIDAKFGEE
jgi:phosphotransferase system HPr-like phosphotransfer protein